MEGLGRLFNYVAVANGVHIPLTNARGVTFFCYEDDGSQVVTLKKSVDGDNEVNLAVIEKVYKGPGVGGTWTKVTQSAAATFDLGDDTTNDCIAIYVDATQLNANPDDAHHGEYNCVELTSDGGTGVTAIVHDLNVQRDPANLAKPVV